MYFKLLEKFFSNIRTRAAIIEDETKFFALLEPLDTVSTQLILFDETAEAKARIVEKSSSLISFDLSFAFLLSANFFGQGL